MNSTQMRKKLVELIAEIEKDRDSVSMNDADPHIEAVMNSILFQCLGMKDEIEKIRRENRSFFSHFSEMEKNAVKQVDEYVWSTMDSIWLDEESWCCASDFEDDVLDWIYVESIYRKLSDLMEYAEEKYGVFQIVE